MRVSYTNHIGRSSRDTHSGKNNTIASLADLAAAEKHNNHNYTQDDINHMQSNIDLSLKHLNRHYMMIDGVLVEHQGYLDLVDNVRKIYDEQFTEAILAYNLHKVAAGHPERQIGSYIDKISEDKQVEVAVEGLIQFGSLEDWQGKTLEERQKAGPLLLQCLIYTLDELKGENKDFILAGASLHLNEGTPHLHYVGVPVQETPDAKNGLKKRVKKAAIFTKDSLGTGLQDHVRKKIAPFVKEALGWEFEEKRSGRNEDLTKNRYVNDMLQKQIQEANKNLQEVNQKLQKSEQKLTDIELTLQSATSDLEHNLRSLSQEVVKTVISDPGGAYSDVLFLFDACSDKRFEELTKESHMLKKSVLGQYASTALSETNLDQRIQNIITGKTRPRELTWEERLALWAKYSQMSNDFWRWRKDLLNRHAVLLHNRYEERYFAKCGFYAAMEMLHESQDLISMLIATAWAIYEIKKEQEINAEIAEIRKQKSILIENTTSFKTFTAAYREELKAGKMPGENLLIAMTNAVEILDQECEKFFAEKPQPKRQNCLASLRDSDPFWR